MRLEDLVDLRRFCRWANGEILDRVAALDAEQYTRDLASSFPSVRDTLVHMLSAEWMWLLRCKGESPMQPLDPTAFADLAALRARWTAHDDEIDGFLGGQSDESVERVIRYRNRLGETREYVLWKIWLHVVNHSTHHRGQVVTMLRQLGASAAPTDYLDYDDFVGGRAY